MSEQDEARLLDGDREWIDARADDLFRASERARGGVRPATITPQDYRDYFVVNAAWERVSTRIAALEAERDALARQNDDLAKALDQNWITHQRVVTAEAERNAAREALAEMTRRRDAWREKAGDVDALRAAVRAGIDDAGGRNLSRVFLRGALEESERSLREARAERDVAHAEGYRWRPVVKGERRPAGLVLLHSHGVTNEGRIVSAIYGSEAEASFEIVIGRWHRGAWREWKKGAIVHDVTHWMPLPDPPQPA